MHKRNGCHVLLLENYSITSKLTHTCEYKVATCEYDAVLAMKNGDWFSSHFTNPGLVRRHVLLYWNHISCIWLYMPSNGESANALGDQIGPSYGPFSKGM